MDQDTIDLLWHDSGDTMTLSGAKQRFRLLERPALDFLDDLNCFTNFVRMLSVLLNSARKLGLPERAIERKWEESSRAFHAICRELDFGHMRDVPSLASLCNRWSQTEPVQGAGCVAVAQLLESLDRRFGPDLFYQRFTDGVPMLGREASLLINAFSKWPRDDACRAGLLAMAGVVACDEEQLFSPEQYQPQALARIINGVAKFPEEARCRRAALAVAEALQQRRDELNDPKQFKPQELAVCLNGLSKWPTEEACRQAARVAAGAVILRTADLHDARQFTPRFLSMVLNGLSKWPREERCRLAAVEVARALWHRREDMNDTGQFNAQDLSNCLNGLGKWPEEAYCRRAAVALAGALPSHQGELGDLPHFIPMHLSSCLNSLGKWPEEARCREAAVTVARALWHRRKALTDTEQFTPHDFSNCFNGLSKWPEEARCRRAAVALAEALLHRRVPAELMQFTPQQLINALNGVSKWPDEKSCRHVAAALAEVLLQRRHELGDAGQFDAQGLSTGLNGLSKFPEEGICRRAALAVAEALLQRWDVLAGTLTPQHLSNCLNGVSKWPEEARCRQAAVALAEALSHRGTLADPRQFSPQQLSNCLNGVSKWPEENSCRQAAVALAEALLQRRHELGHAGQFNAQGLSNCLNGLSRWPETEICRQAALAVAEALLQRWEVLAGQGQLRPRHVASCLNGSSKWLQEGTFQEVAIRIIEMLGSGGHPFSAFTMGQLAQLVNGTARFILELEEATEAADAMDAVAIRSEESMALAQTRLRELAAHLDSRPDRLGRADTRNVAVIFKALASTRLKDGLRLLALQGLARLRAIHADTGFRPDNLEALASLAAGLLPLVRAPELARKHRAGALRLLEQMQPAVDRKMRLYLETYPASSTAPRSLGVVRDGEAFGTHRPGLTFFLLLKTYAVVADLWKRSNVPDAPGPARVRREALKAWVAKTLESTRGVIEDDLDEMSWNLIAQIEAGDEVIHALDLRLRRDLEKIVSAHPSTPLDVAAVRRELRSLTEVRDVMTGNAGAAVIQVIDLHGRDVRAGKSGRAEEAAAPQYSFFTRLTNGQVPLMEVQLPGRVSPHLLARTIQRDGDLLRMDLFGGSHLKPVRARAHELLAAGGAAGETKRHGRLPALRLADTAPQAALMKDVIRKLNPQREDWFRMQRALLETVPRDHVVEGPIRLALLADRPQGHAPAFPLRTPEGEAIQLVPNDGCGFIKQSLACRIPVIRQAIEARQTPPDMRTKAQRSLVAGTQRMSLLPPQATHHFPRDAGAIEEARQHLRTSLRDDPDVWDADPSTGARTIKAHKLYEALAGALITGTQATAVPSADDKVYLPGTKSKVFDATGGDVLLGKAPYDKANLMPVKADRIGTARKGDATARFLEETFAFQYSYTAWDESGAPAAEDAAMVHGKGVTIVVPDAMWPTDNDAQWVWSTEDMKVHSSWTEGRRRDRLAPRMDTVGSLRVKEIFPPGSLIALPIDELRKRDADCDGDKVFVYAGLPKMVEAVERSIKARDGRAGKAGSFKPPKTAHEAFDAEGQYQAGRAAEVLSALRGQELVGRFSTMQFQFFGQPPALREALAESALFGTYEGTERELRRGVRALLRSPQEATPQAVEDLLQRARLGVQCACHPVARQAAEALQAHLTAFVREMHAPTPPSSLPPAAPEAQQALSEALAQRFPSLAQACELANTPSERLAAWVTHYPIARLPHPATTPPAGRSDPPRDASGRQPGHVPGAPLDTLHNLLTLGVKVGTDAPKAVTQTDLYHDIANHLDKVLRNEPDRIRLMPYTKAGVVQELRNNRFHAQANLERLRDNPTLTAGLMEMAIHELLDQGVIESTPQLRASPRETEAQLKHLARTLRAAARLAEPRMTNMIEAAIEGNGVLRGRAHRIKSEGALVDKLQAMMHTGHQTPEEAAEALNDALRYSIVLAPGHFAAGYASILRELDEQGLTKTLVHNAFVSPHPAFKGINVKFMGRDAEGQTLRVEVQFHTEETFELKERFHDDYKRESALRTKGASIEERRAQVAEAREACKGVATPPGCEHIEDWETELPRVDKRRASAAPSSATGTARAPTAMDVQVRQLMQGAGLTERQVTPILEGLALNVVRAHSVAKKAKSIEKKIHRLSVLEDITIEQAAARVHDAMRWVVLLPGDTFGAEAAQALKDLQARGLRVMRVNNGFAAREKTYAGLNVKLRTAQGLDFEIQFHTAESLHTRNTLTHKLYRRWQDKEVERRLASDPAQRQMLKEANAGLLLKLKAYADTVPMPAGVDLVKSVNHRKDETVAPLERLPSRLPAARGRERR
ncbi:type III effector protein skwp2 [Rhizobacter sp. Root1221]|nr:type III effector protein skwp2 [Rhizobacter sp. Root1221]